MHTMNDEPSLFDDDPPVPTEHLVRTNDPDTSHEAARRLTTGRSHCLAILRAHHLAYSTNVPALATYEGLTDAQAAFRADLLEPGVCWWHRCSDLRKLGLIAWAVGADGEPIKRDGPNGRPVRVSAITEAGREELRHHDRSES